MAWYRPTEFDDLPIALWAEVPSRKMPQRTTFILKPGDFVRLLSGALLRSEPQETGKQLWPVAFGRWVLDYRQKPRKTAKNCLIHRCTAAR